MAEKITTFQCPSCTGPLRYDGGSGKLTCDYCGSSFSVQEIEGLYGEKLDQAAQAASKETAAWNWDTAGSDWGEAEQHLKSYNCPSCGAELICEETTAASSCPYCGNPVVASAQFNGMLKPDFIIPFKLSKEQAVEALRQFYHGKKLLPKSFRAENHIQEVKGVYVPFWLFDGQAEADIQFMATRSRIFTQGNKRITETDHFQVRRSGTVSFQRIPVDGSKKMPDALMDAIEPFDYKELKPFSAAYLPGFLADKYDMNESDCEGRATRRAAKTAAELMAETVAGYTTCTVTNSNVRTIRGDVKYALLPVWMLATQWHGKSFLFAMNGQTGKLIGDLPESSALYWSWFARIAVPIAAITGIVLHFFM